MNCSGAAYKMAARPPGLVVLSLSPRSARGERKNGNPGCPSCRPGLNNPPTAVGGIPGVFIQSQPSRVIRHDLGATSPLEVPQTIPISQNKLPCTATGSLTGVCSSSQSASDDGESSNESGKGIAPRLISSRFPSGTLGPSTTNTGTQPAFSASSAPAHVPPFSASLAI